MRPLRLHQSQLKNILNDARALIFIDLTGLIHHGVLGKTNLSPTPQTSKFDQHAQQHLITSTPINPLMDAACRWFSEAAEWVYGLG